MYLCVCVSVWLCVNCCLKKPRLLVISTIKLLGHPLPFTWQLTLVLYTSYVTTTKREEEKIQCYRNPVGTFVKYSWCVNSDVYQCRCYCALAEPCYGSYVSEYLLSPRGCNLSSSELCSIWHLHCMLFVK